jgi:hypothetical protein
MDYGAMSWKLRDELKNHGIRVNDSFPIEIEGKLQRGKYTVDGSVSSQFITGLLLALPQAGGGKIEVTGSLQSRSYIDIKISVMKKFGVDKSETLVIGDRLYTDVASGNNAGVDTVCVLSGEATLEDIQNAQGVEKPAFVFDSVKNLLLEA